MATKGKRKHAEIVARLMARDMAEALAIYDWTESEFHMREAFERFDELTRHMATLREPVTEEPPVAIPEEDLPF